MLSGYYAIASGMMMHQRSLNVLGNNITNAKTPGFRAARVVSTTFDYELTMRMEKGNTAVIGSSSPIRLTEEVPVRFDTAALEETQRPFDMALDGPGFFQVEGEGGARYLTRNGNFDQDAEGYLILRGVGRVLGTGGTPIRVQGSGFTVLPNGQVQGPTGNNLGTLSVVVIPEGAQLQSNTNGAYTIENMNQVQQLATAQVAQGWLERSNIDITQEYAMVMEAQRAFQSCSSALQIIDRLNQKAATQIASV